jgi:Domain of unknown function (DUF4337)
MSEGIEIPGHEHGHGGHGGEENPLVLPVSLTMSIMAVVLAAVTLLAHRTSTHELLLQAEATDQWSYYQAKNIRLHEMEANVDIFSTLSPKEAAKAEAMVQKYEKQVAKYESDKEDISEKAKDLEKERDILGRRADRFEGGEVFLEVALVICSITLLTNKKAFWFLGILLGIAGLAVAATAWLVH